MAEQGQGRKTYAGFTVPDIPAKAFEPLFKNIDDEAAFDDMQAVASSSSSALPATSYMPPNVRETTAEESTSADSQEPDELVRGSSQLVSNYQRKLIEAIEMGKSALDTNPQGNNALVLRNMIRLLESAGYEEAMEE